MNRKILLIDNDTEATLNYVALLQRKFQLFQTESGEEAVKILFKESPVALIVCSNNLQEGVDGIEFLTHIRVRFPASVRMFLAAPHELERGIDALNAGHVSFLIIKTYTPDQIGNIIQAGMDQYNQVQSEHEVMSRTLKGSVKMLVEILSITNPLAFSQSERITGLCGNIADRLKIDNGWEVELAALLSQIGCVTIPRGILRKRNQGQVLTGEEKEIFLSHPYMARKLLTNVPRLEGIAEAVYYQMKDYNGGGYPVSNKKGRDIPITSRILKVVLDYDHMTYIGMKRKKAINMLRENNHKYDPDVLAALEAELMGAQEGMVVRCLQAEQLQTGMILAEDLTNRKGVVLLSKAHTITEVLKMSLLNYAQAGAISEPIKVLVPA